jgi:acyl carrier protein
VLDERMRPVPVGAPGELCIGGILARGYLRRPGLTAERFVPDAFSGVAGARLYRTGDRARWTESGSIEFLGRADQQVKVRGFRVELGEVEAALLRLPGVRAAAADVRGGAIAAYVVASGDVDAGAADQALRRALPEHTVPSAILRIDALPLTANGKLDRAALPDPRHASAESKQPPETETEIELAALWSELLEVDEIGADDSFFALGGHSLRAMQLVSRVRQAMDVELPLRDVFEAPRLRAMAAAVDLLRDEALAAQLAELDPEELEALLAAAEVEDDR